MRRAVLATLVVVGVLFLLGAVWYYASMSGGLDDAFRKKKTASSPDVRAARRDADAVVERMAAPLRLRFAEPREECRPGQHNWKIDDDYDVACHLVATAPTESDPKSLRALHQRLRAAGWYATGGIPEALDAGAKGSSYENTAGPEYELNVEWHTSGEVTLRYEFFRG